MHLAAYATGTVPPAPFAMYLRAGVEHLGFPVPVSFLGKHFRCAMYASNPGSEGCNFVSCM